jgi:hypothetical protein
LSICKLISIVRQGFLPGWWLGAEDNRAEEPYISPERWTTELVAAGFQVPDAIVLDYVFPDQLSAGILASHSSRITKPPRVTLLCHTPDAPYVADMRQCLEKLDICIDICQFGQALPSQDVVSLLDLQHPLIHGMSEHTFSTLIGLLKSLKANIIWVTPASQVNCEDPRAAMILGLARTARSEMSIKLFTVEVDSVTAPSVATEAIAKILLQVNTPDIHPEHTDPDYEFAVSNGGILIPRLHWQTMSNAFAQDKQEAKVAVRKKMDIKTPGLLHTMYWREEKTQTPAEGEVLVQAKAAGLNFKARTNLSLFTLITTLTILLITGPLGGSWCT